MKKLFSFLRDMKSHYHRYGVIKTVATAFDRLVNKVLYFDRWLIIILERDNLEVPVRVEENKLSCRLATYEDLLDMEAQNTWEIGKTKLDHFKNGDQCLLSFVDSRLAGYTWAHLKGCPVLMPGFRCRMPLNYVYNYAGFTLPEFRGLQLQPYRHFMLLQGKGWEDRNGLLGYVKYNNWSSRRGQSKSGYQPVGSIWFIGTKKRYLALFTKNVRKLGIHRIPIDM